MFSFGISLHSIFFPQIKLTASSSLDTIVRIFKIAYLPMFGEVSILEEFQKNTCASNETDSDNCRTSSEQITGFFMIMVYMIISSVLLLNIIIALFGYVKSDALK